MSWLWMDRIVMFWFVLSLKSVIAAISQNSVSLALVAPSEAAELYYWCPGMPLYVREGFRSFRLTKLKFSCHETRVFRICSRINNFYVYAFYHNPGLDC